MSYIVIEGLTKSFGNNNVLAGCSLSVERGTVTTLLGPSGCGKTTLLRSIAGFVQPDSGQINVGGRALINLPPYERQVGYVFQNYALFPHLTVADNVGYGLRVRRRAANEIRDRVAAALDLVALREFADRWPSQLSGGQQQRVAIARALVLEPDVLLLDEPFNALDARLRLAMQIELRKLIEKIGVTSIFVTHDQAEAMALSDMIAVMNSGKIEQVAPPLVIYDRPSTAYVATFIGRANLLPVVVSGGIVIGLSDIVGPNHDGPATLIVRPENLFLSNDDTSCWRGMIAFSTTLGAVVEYEIDVGLREPLRIISGRQAFCTPLPAGTRVNVGVIDPTACIIIPGEFDGR